MSKLWSFFIIFGVVISIINNNICNITDTVISSGKDALTIAVTMYGIVPIWCGIMKIAEYSGILKFLTKSMYPIMKRLFPDIPKNSSALKHISTNISANILGLGWAATPSGIEAMKSLSELNHKKNDASRSMCMFMVINMSSVQLITINILAYRTNYGSTSPALVILPGIIATLISTAVGIITVKIAERIDKK